MRWTLGLILLIGIYKTVWSSGVYPSLGQSVLVSRSLQQQHHARFKRSPVANDREKCQNTTPPPSPTLNQVRTQMNVKNVKAYIVPMDDSHQSEYVSDHDKRIKFLSSFTGSAGTVVITTDAAALWTDGRYFLQGEDELDCNWILMKSGVEGVPSISEWLIEELNSGDKVGADSELLSYDAWNGYKEPLEAANLILEEQNGLIDTIWDAGNRPTQTNEDILILDMKYAGESWEQKVQRVRNHMVEKSADAVVVTALDDSAWLFNLRGSDIVYNPVFYAYSIIRKADVRLYISQKKQSAEVRDHLKAVGCTGSSCVMLKDYDSFMNDLAQTVTSDSKVLVSPMSSYAVYSVTSNKAELDPPIVRILKGRKNKVEVESLRTCHKRDSAALIEFLVGLEKDVKTGSQTWTEVSAAASLAEKRTEQDLNKGLSFATISAVGSNGAIIHYKPTPVTDKTITTTEMYLLDSGGQYLDGTTDVTRTFHFGTPTPQEKEAYTRVLMGAIDLATSVWPNGTYGRDIDVLARRPLWSVGWDYRHGTGHGIGMFLNVHEGPGRINIGYREHRYESPLWGEMFHSDEPGYYEDGKFGVRLETIVMTTKVDTKYQFGDVDYIGFEAFTLVPFEKNLIDYDLLSTNQRKWLNQYHERCRKEVGEDILQERESIAAYEWVLERTEPIPEEPNYTAGAPISVCHWPVLIAVLMMYMF